MIYLAAIGDRKGGARGLGCRRSTARMPSGTKRREAKSKTDFANLPAVIALWCLALARTSLQRRKFTAAWRKQNFDALRSNVRSIVRSLLGIPSAAIAFVPKQISFFVEIRGRGKGKKIKSINTQLTASPSSVNTDILRSVHAVAASN